MQALATEQPLAGVTAECFHCGLQVPPGPHYTALVDGELRQLCCRGCQAVTAAIAAAGLADYYRHRTAPAASQRDPAIPAELRLFDVAEVQKSFVRDSNDGLKEATILFEGITCAACIWLIERHVAALTGVASVQINYATRRARVTWHKSRIELSAILHAISSIGYRAYPYDAARCDDAYRRERKAALWRLFVAGFGMMQVMMYAAPLYFADADMSNDIAGMMRWASFILTAPVVLYAAAPIYTGAWRDLRTSRIGMDVPVALGIGAAFAASVWATLTASGEVYYDSITMFIFLLLTARFFEFSARAQAAQAADELVKLVPAVAERMPNFPASRATEHVPVAQLEPGDLVLVRPGAPIPADGCLVEGKSQVDEALMTGESRPIAKCAGDTLIGGAVNIASPLIMRVERVGEQTTLAAIVRLLDRAMSEKPRIAELADRVAQRFLASLLILAAAVGAIWLWVAPERALWVTISVLVVTCPCALSLATPAALAAATGRLTRRGILITRGHALETMVRASHFVFDKTGTLTHGRFDLIGISTLRTASREQCLALAAALESSSEHQIARAICKAAGSNSRLDVRNVVNFPGCGVEGLVAGRQTRIGTPSFVAAIAGAPDANFPRTHLKNASWPFVLRYRSMNGCIHQRVSHVHPSIPQGERIFDTASSCSQTGATVVALGDASGWLAEFMLGDQIRSEARDVIQDLVNRGKSVALLSGDQLCVAQRVASEVGISTVVAGVSPQNKLDYLRHLQAEGHTVAVIGDGINDAPMLAGAAVSIAMGSGTHVAHASADAILLSDRLDSLTEVLDVATRTMRVIRQNLAWAIAYNITALPLAMLGYVTPWIAAIGMATSSLLVVANALRLARPELRYLNRPRPWKFSIC